jgi:hypothetical protein
MAYRDDYFRAKYRMARDYNYYRYRHRTDAKNAAGGLFIILLVLCVIPPILFVVFVGYTGLYLYRQWKTATTYASEMEQLARLTVLLERRLDESDTDIYLRGNSISNAARNRWQREFDKASEQLDQIKTTFNSAGQMGSSYSYLPPINLCRQLIEKIERTYLSVIGQITETDYKEKSVALSYVPETPQKTHGTALVDCERESLCKQIDALLDVVIEQESQLRDSESRRRKGIAEEAKKKFLARKTNLSKDELLELLVAITEWK